MTTEDEPVGVVRRDVGERPRTTPRIRDITGIRIHQLTLPQSIPLASKLVSQPSPTPDLHDFHITLGESSKLSSSPDALTNSEGVSRRARRESNSTLHNLHVPEKAGIPSSPSRSGAVPISPVGSTFRRRDRDASLGRPRSQTLAGEALEHANSVHDGDPEGRFGEVIAEEEVIVGRRLARSFFVMRPSPVVESEVSDLHDARPRMIHSSSHSGLKSPTPLAQNRLRNNSSPGQPPTNNTPVKRRAFGKPQAPEDASTVNSADLSNHVADTAAGTTGQRTGTASNMPFYISRIHRPSIYPRFSTLSIENDFSPWITTEQAASHSFILEIWYEDLDPGQSQWKLAEDLSRHVDLKKLRRRPTIGDETGHSNIVEFTLAFDPRSTYYLPSAVSSDEGPEQKDGEVVETESGGRARSASVRHIVQRSLRETRMKQGIGVGPILQLVNLQSLVKDAEDEIEQVQGRINDMLDQDVDWSRIRRAISERESRRSWMESKVEEVDKIIEEVQARITLRKRANEARRIDLEQAAEKNELLHGKCFELHSAIDAVEFERLSSVPQIQHWRMQHAQALDNLFPIQSLHPPTLLYSILAVPLPIPSSPKDPAPPLTVPSGSIPNGIKIDERTNAAALSYSAMVVQILSHLGGSTTDLPYPITCAGSRSLVKDVVSVMQGPRSFPLYAKGVERYRYEYAVFLLNKNIEMLMQESNIRALDVRQTLPNLKSLLLTLSSPVSSSQSSLSRSVTQVDSRNTSRQTSYTFPSAQAGQSGLMSPGRSSIGTGRGPESPASTSSKRLGMANPSPLSQQSKIQAKGRDRVSPLTIRPPRPTMGVTRRSQAMLRRATGNEVQGDAHDPDDDDDDDDADRSDDDGEDGEKLAGAESLPVGRDQPVNV